LIGELKVVNKSEEADSSDAMGDASTRMNPVACEEPALVRVNLNELAGESVPLYAKNEFVGRYVIWHRSVFAVDTVMLDTVTEVALTAAWLLAVANSPSAAHACPGTALIIMAAPFGIAMAREAKASWFAEGVPGTPKDKGIVSFFNFISNVIVWRIGNVGQRLSTNPALLNELEVSNSTMYFKIGSPPSLNGAEYLTLSLDDSP
jgi:hypothetical protein